jgi:hypothetical protein
MECMVTLLFSFSHRPPADAPALDAGQLDDPFRGPASRRGEEIQQRIRALRFDVEVHGDGFH